MPFYRYQARDPSGRRVEGTIEAGDPQAAASELAARGVRVQSLVDTRHAMDQRGKEPGRRGIAVKRTRYGTDGERMFLFSQVASYLRAGVNPAEAFARLGQSWPNAAFRDSLREIGHAAVEGRRVSDILESYPYLYPPHVVGVYRVGEISGALPEACDVIAKQAEDSKGFRRSFWILAVAASSFVILVPAALIPIRGILDAFRDLDRTGGGPGALIGAMARQLVWSVGPWALVGMLALWLLLKVWWSMPLRLPRHRAVLYLPGIGLRARLESVTLLAWALSKLAKAGLPPKSSLQCAAEAVPNLELRRRLELAAERMSDKDQLSSTLQGIDFIPQDMAPMVATGEMTGDLPYQLGFVERASRSEFESAESATKKRAGCWVFLLYMIGVAYLIYLIYAIFYGNVFRITDEWSAGWLPPITF